MNKNDLTAVLAKNSSEDEKLRKSLPAWILFFCLAGFEYYPEEKIAYQEKAAAAAAKSAGLTLADSVSGVAAYKFLERIQRPAAEPHWKPRRKGACLELFFLTTLDRVAGFIDILQKQAGRHDYPAADIGIYVQPMVQGTSCHCEFDLFYDPRNAAEIATMKKIYLQAGEALMNAGADPQEDKDDATGIGKKA